MRYADIYWVEFTSNSIGHEFRGRRPAVIIQSDAQIQKTTVISVMPLTSNQGNKMPDDVFAAKDAQNNLFADSVVKVHHIKSYDRSRFIRKIGVADGRIMEEIKAYLKKHFEV